MPTPPVTCEQLIPRFGCGWIHRHEGKRMSCNALLESRTCPLLMHRTLEEWAHVPTEIMTAVKAGRYPSERLLRWERIVDDLLAFVLLKVDGQWGDSYMSLHAALGILMEEVHEFQMEVFNQVDSRKGRLDRSGEAIKVVEEELRDVASVSLMTLFHLTPFQEVEP